MFVQEWVDRHVDLNNLHWERAAPRPQRPPPHLLLHASQAHHAHQVKPNKNSNFGHFGLLGLVAPNAKLTVFLGGCLRVRKTSPGRGLKRRCIQWNSPRSYMHLLACCQILFTLCDCVSIAENVWSCNDPGHPLTVQSHLFGCLWGQHSAGVKISGILLTCIKDTIENIPFT